MDYIAIIHKESDSDFGVSFPDFPGCVTAGSSLQEARDMAGEALALHIEGMEEDGEDIPAPSSLDTIMKDPDFADGVACIIPYEGKPKTVRVNITMTETTLAAFDKFAEKQGMTRSGFLTKAAESYIKHNASVA